MSGGSYNYLHSKLRWGDGELDSFMYWFEQLREDLAIAAAEAPESDRPAIERARQRLTEIHASLQAAAAELETYADLAQAVEWRRSGDWGLDAIVEEASKLATKVVAP